MRPILYNAKWLNCNVSSFAKLCYPLRPLRFKKLPQRTQSVRKVSQRCNACCKKTNPLPRRLSNWWQDFLIWTFRGKKFRIEPARRFLSNFKEPFSPKTTSNEKSHIPSHNYFLCFSASLLQIFFARNNIKWYWHNPHQSYFSGLGWHLSGCSTVCWLRRTRNVGYSWKGLKLHC